MKIAEGIIFSSDPDQKMKTMLLNEIMNVETTLFCRQRRVLRCYPKCIFLDQNAEDLK